MLTLISEKQREHIQERRLQEIELRRQREIQILHLLNEGKTYQQIAQTICISHSIVRDTISDLLKINKCQNSLELLKLARLSNFFNDQKQEA